MRWWAVVVTAFGLLAGCTTTPATVRPPVAPAPTAKIVRITYPAQGHGEWRSAPGSPRTAGTGGPLLRYRVLVESDITGVRAADFAASVAATLGDRRGWTADGALRLRRVGTRGPADFTIFLATPGTRDQLCAGGTDGYTSCRNGDRVVLNVARWVKGVPGFGASLSTYRTYMVDHEVGHRLGHGHELCPGRGRPAPVMQQQTLGLHGCTPNPWPYLKGTRYDGRPGAYDDRQPAADRGAD